MIIPRRTHGRGANPVSSRLRIMALSAVAASVLLVATAPLAAEVTPTPPPGGWTLEALIARALSANPEVRRAAAAKQAQRGRRLDILGGVLPQLSLNGRIHWSDDRLLTRAVDPTSGSSISFGTTRQWTTDLTVEQVLFGGGRALASAQVERAVDTAVAAEARATEHEVSLGVIQAYWAYHYARDVSAATARHVEALAAQAAATQARQRSGAATEIDVLNAAAALANARTNHVRATLGVETAFVNLRAAVDGTVPAAPTDLAPTVVPAAAAASSALAAPLDALTTQALAQRPEAQALRARVEAAQHRVRLARSDAGPTILGAAAYELRNPTSDRDPDRIKRGWTLGIAGSWTLFDGLALRGRILEAQAAYQSAAADLAALTAAIRSELATARAQVAAALAIHSAATQALQAAQAAEALAQARYRVGVATLTDVLAATAAALQARVDVAAAERDLAVAQATLATALGQAPHAHLAPLATTATSARP